jgi:hypothetical protein
MRLLKITLSLSLLLCVTFAVNAKTISPEQARTAATNFFLERINQVQSLAAKDLSVAEQREVRKDGQLLYYVLNFSRGGWVLMSGDDRFIPVIGYAFSGIYGSKDGSCCVKFWMDKVNENITSALNENAPALEAATAQWNDLLTRDAENPPVFKSKAVAPLTLSYWDQGKYYNALCPAASDGPDGHALVGCVATSMTQIMYYYRYPAQGLGSHGGINMGSFYYRWNEMMNSLFTYNQGVAEISYHAGEAVDMSYSGTGSGAQTSDVPTAMVNHFRYASAADYASKFAYTTANWNALLIGNLDALHPMIYSGSDPVGGGHAWVCDGYQGTDYYHMNWGWGGSADGYFYTNNLTAGGYTFSDWQGVVYDLYPPTASYPSYCSGLQTVNYTHGTIVDGSGPNNYGNNSNCQWLIEPTAEVISKLTLRFDAFETENTNDVVTIYDGNSTAAPVLATYSGSTLPANVVTTGPVAFVTFVSNASTTSPGWQIEYRSSYPIYCSGITTLTTPTGSITDGSGSNDYSYNQTCRWRIQPPGVESITINFTALNIATDDYIIIYNENTGAAYDTIKGTSIPPQTTYPTNKVLVLFKTNSANNAAGWDLNYTSTVAGLQENPEMGSCVVYPNPAQDKVFIEFTPTNEQDVSIDILGIDGRAVLHQSLSKISSAVKVELDLSSLSSGLYMLRLSGKKGSLITKLIVE